MQRSDKMPKIAGKPNLLGVESYENPVSFSQITQAMTGNKMADLRILSELEDRDLLNFCLLGEKNADIRNLCNDAQFWRSRFIAKYQPPMEWIQKQNMTVWKKLYLQILSYADLGNRGYFYKSSPLYYAAKDGNINAIDFMIARGAKDWKDGLLGAIELGDLSLVKFFEAKQQFTESDYQEFLGLAIEVKDKTLVIYFLTKPGTNIGWAIRYSENHSFNGDMLKLLYQLEGAPKMSLRDLKIRLANLYQRNVSGAIVDFYEDEIRERSSF